MLFDELEIEWNDDESANNYAKYGIVFLQTLTIWQDPNSIEIVDFNQVELRWARVGFSSAVNALIVVLVEKAAAGRIRIISARKATKKESLQYRKGGYYE